MSGQEFDIKARVAQNIVAAMAARELSSAELARQLGLNEKTVRRWRTGEALPGVERLAEIAEVLGRDALDFYRETEKAA